MERVPVTKEGYEALKRELENLKRVERPENIKAIEEERAHGDGGDRVASIFVVAAAHRVDVIAICGDGGLAIFLAIHDAADEDAGVRHQGLVTRGCRD